MEKDVHTKLIDTGAGFYLDEEDLAEEKRKESQIVIEPCTTNFLFILNELNTHMFRTINQTNYLLSCSYTK